MMESSAEINEVVRFMMLQLQKLPEETQNSLKIAACIGNKFDLATLAVVCQKPETDVATNLKKALKDGVISAGNKIRKFYLESQTSRIDLTRDYSTTYTFLHNQYQEASYALIPEEEKPAIHYRIGQMLLQKTPGHHVEERIFELLNQLNHGKSLIVQQQERDELAELNLIGCQKAKNTTAYQASREYANIGLFLLGEKAWHRQYSTNLALHNLAAELAWLCGDFKLMEQFIDTVLSKAQSLLEKVNVYRVRIQSNSCQNKLVAAITDAQQLLEKLGVTFPETPTQEDIQQAINSVDILIGDKQIEDFANLPTMVNEEKIAIVQIASSILPATYISGSPLFPLLVALSVKLSIQYGNTSFSASAYAPYGILACNMKLDIETGVKFGELALEIVSKLDAKAVKPEILNVVSNFILHRKFHLKETLPLLQEGYNIGLQVGNLEFVGYNAHNFCFHSFWCAHPLAILEQDTRDYYNHLLQINQRTTANYCLIYCQSILNLLKAPENRSISFDVIPREKEFLASLIEAGDLYGLHVFYLYKLMLCYMFEDLESAQKHVVELKRYLLGVSGTFAEPIFYFYDSLTALTALNSQCSDRKEVLQRVEQNQMQLQEYWARYSPMNHQHKVDLVEAEKYRVLENETEAIELFNKAIAGARANQYTQEEALANELAAKFYIGSDREHLATHHMQEAYHCYTRWGANAKTQDLRRRYPQLLTGLSG